MEEYVYQCLNAIPATNMKSVDEDEAYKQELEGLGGFRKFRITQMFSATMPQKLEKMARQYCRCPSMIRVGDPMGGNKMIDQRIRMISEADKKKELEHLLRSDDFETPCIIFVNMRKAADLLGKFLDTQLGYEVFLRNAVLLVGGLVCCSASLVCSSSPVNVRLEVFTR